MADTSITREERYLEYLTGTAKEMYRNQSHAERDICTNYA